MRILVQRLALLTILVVTVALPTSTNVKSADPTLQVISFKPQLWAPDQPVDILVYNPNNEPLQLPEPYTPPSTTELYGPGVTEEGLTSLAQTLDPLAPIVVMVGPNVTFLISYGDGANEGFNDPTLGIARRAAFQFAVNIWADRLQGPAAISVQATMTPLGGSPSSATLASCGPGQFHRDFTHAPLTHTYYPESLVEIISGSDPDSSTFDINVDFNSDVDNSFVLGNIDWYYGTDANPGPDIDFVTTTIHELAHGLGFISSFNSDGTFGQYDDEYPVIYDLYLVNGAGTQLITLPASPGNVTGNNVFWNGLRGRFAFNNDFGGAGDIPIFAPTPWDAGSSISHLDETTFTGAWDLETPYYDSAVHNPDTIVMGIMQDIGHSLPQSRYVDVNASGFEDGSSANPFNTVTEGVTDVPTDGFLRILPGTYLETLTINRSMELHSSGGTATIGTGGVSSSQEPQAQDATP